MCRWFREGEDAGADSPDPGFHEYRRFCIPSGQVYDGLAKGGDTLVLEIVRDLRNPNAGMEGGYIGSWLVLLRWSPARLEYIRMQHGYHPDWVTRRLREPPWWLVKLERPGRKYLHGSVYDSKGELRGRLIRIDPYDVYRVMEVQPGADREWRDDPEFLAAVRMLKA